MEYIITETNRRTACKNNLIRLDKDYMRKLEEERNAKYCDDSEIDNVLVTTLLDGIDTQVMLDPKFSEINDVDIEVFEVGTGNLLFSINLFAAMSSYIDNPRMCHQFITEKVNRIRFRRQWGLAEGKEF